MTLQKNTVAITLLIVVVIMSIVISSLVQVSAVDYTLPVGFSEADELSIVSESTYFIASSTSTNFSDVAVPITPGSVVSPGGVYRYNYSQFLNSYHYTSNAFNFNLPIRIGTVFNNDTKYNKFYYVLSISTFSVEYYTTYYPSTSSPNTTRSYASTVVSNDVVPINITSSFLSSEYVGSVSVDSNTFLIFTLEADSSDVVSGDIFVLANISGVFHVPTFNPPSGGRFANRDYSNFNFTYNYSRLYATGDFSDYYLGWIYEQLEEDATRDSEFQDKLLNPSGDQQSVLDSMQSEQESLDKAFDSLDDALKTPDIPDNIVTSNPYQNDVESFGDFMSSLVYGQSIPVILTVVGTLMLAALVLFGL